ncbi:MAG: hypothetical protein AAFX79_02460 [Planctomycetota bacterium]
MRRGTAIAVCALLALLAAPSTADEPWLEPGRYQWGYRYWASTLTLEGRARDWEMQISYPATSRGEDAPIVPNAGPLPFIVFAHAGGSDYDWYDYLFPLLASRGVIIASVRHNGDWHSGPGDVSDLHRELLRATTNRVLQWSQSPGHFLFGKVDDERYGLAGHSHGAGAALYLVGSSPGPPLDPEFMVLLAPCPLPYGTPIGDYAVRYPGMPATQVVYGSRDEDGCVANGQSIAIYEYGDRLRHYAYVDGSGHHAFDDHGALGATVIPRHEAQDAAASAIVPFVVHHFFDDEAALDALRRSHDLLEDGATVHYQIHEPERLVIDNFEDDSTESFADAIVGIPGQTFVNGFLSDTFVDREVGIRVLREELRALLAEDEGARVLFFLDNIRGTDLYRPALNAEAATGRVGEIVQVSDRREFATRIVAGGWDLIISANQDGSSTASHPFDAPLAAYVCGGGRAIISDFRVGSPTLPAVLACAGAAYDGQTNYDRMFPVERLFNDHVALFRNPGWGIWTASLEEVGAGVSFANNDLDRVGGVGDPFTNSLGLPVAYAPELDVADERWMLDFQTLYWPTSGLDVAWTTTGLGFYETLSDSGGLDARCWMDLSFRLAQLHGDPRNPVGAEIDLSVELHDQSGRVARLRLSDAPQGPLAYPDGPAPGIGWKTMFETYRFPLAAFVAAEPELDLTRLAGLAIVFDGRATGRLVLDDIELAGRVRSGADVDGSGAIDAFDVLAMADLVARGAPAADLDRSGRVDTLDVLRLLEVLGDPDACP